MIATPLTTPNAHNWRSSHNLQALILASNNTTLQLQGHTFKVGTRNKGHTKIKASWAQTGVDSASELQVPNASLWITAHSFSKITKHILSESRNSSLVGDSMVTARMIKRFTELIRDCEDELYLVTNNSSMILG
ncbi:hypothetical protein Tco_0656040 [Tanacetum coccineum]|uniref:Uncharacterized protein n=1 Tax=Tanacetum coccineum TaxID=301880 RepID=A0ABQ4X7N7_9ASTR